MKLQVTRTVTEEIEVEGEFPLYKKHGGSYYILLSEKEYVQISLPMVHAKVDISSVSHCEIAAIAGKVLNEGDTITENEFIDAYVKAFFNLHKLVNPSAELYQLILKESVYGIAETKSKAA